MFRAIALLLSMEWGLDYKRCRVPYFYASKNGKEYCVSLMFVRLSGRLLITNLNKSELTEKPDFLAFVIDGKKGDNLVLTTNFLDDRLGDDVDVFEIAKHIKYKNIIDVPAYIFSASSSELQKEVDDDQNNAVDHK
jgi:hypothetical protein